jgi:tetratricopeptide (TPR) repeat protein
VSRFTTRALSALLVSTAAAPAFAQDGDQHLRLGAAHFRAGRFEEAVVEFKVARELGSTDDGQWYIAAALTRAGRHLDALEAFSEAAELAPRSADALFLYYRGVACSEAQLVVCAATSFELAAKSAGPKVAEQARRLAGEARALLVTEPPRAAIDELVSRAEDAQRKQRKRLSGVFAQEAAALASKRSDRWRAPEIEKLIARGDGGRP